MINEQDQLMGDTNTEPRRVKVYILEDDEWKDTGTGFCIGQCERSAASAYLLVRDEDRPDRILLKSKLEGNIEYQRQEETLIVWKDVQGQDIALSFEESTGCNTLCEFICLVQKTFENNISLVSVRSNEDGMGSVHEIITGPVHLPSNEPLQNENTLLEALKILNENTAFEFLKNETVDFIVKSNYLKTLIDHFHHAEEQHLYKDLLLLSHIIKTLFLYNQREVLEQLIDDEHYIGAVGILEYDTDFPESKANHRKCLEETKPTLKEVIPLDDEQMRQIIKKTFRLQFLKDVVLVRFLDDQSTNLISDVMFNYQSNIIQFLQQGQFIDQLMSLYYTDPSSTDPVLIEKKRQGIKLLGECVQITCNLDPPERSSFYKILVKKGLFNVLDFAFNVETNSEVRILATDMIISIIEHDILLINTAQNEMLDESLDEEHANASNINQRDDNGHDLNGVINKPDMGIDGEFSISGSVHSIHPNIQPQQPQQQRTSDISLLLILSKILLTDKSPGLKEQAFQALVTLLDPEDFMGDSYEDQSSIENLMKFYSNNKVHDKSTGPYFQLIDYFNKFYKQVAPVLFNCLITGNVEDKDDQLLIRLVKLVDLLVHEHDIVLSRRFILENGILVTISKLMSASHILQLRLTALRCFKGIIMLNDDFYHRYIISKNLIDPICQLLEENLYKDNMANSCVLDFLKQVSTYCQQAQEISDFNKKNFVSLNKYLVERFERQLEKVDYVPFTATMIRLGNAKVPDRAETNGAEGAEFGGPEGDEENDLGCSELDTSSSGSSGGGPTKLKNEIAIPITVTTSKRTFSDLDDGYNTALNAPVRRISFNKMGEEIPVASEDSMAD